MTVPRLTVAQALIRFLTNQYVERDGNVERFFYGCFGIFGHGNVAGIGQALQEADQSLPYFQGKNEQAMVHIASGFARMNNRLRAMACTSSIGPGATNMVTGAALATINRLPVLLLPGDIFASRLPDPVLQQLEHPLAGDVSVNDCFRPVSRYFDRVTRPEQLPSALLNAMTVLTSPALTGAVTIALPQDVQTEAFEVPRRFLEKRIWPIPRAVPDESAIRRAAESIRAASRPLIVAGGGVIYSSATDALDGFARQTGIPVGQTQAGMGSLLHGHPCLLGGIGATGTRCANRIGATADLVIGIGTRWTDFTTASRSLFQHPEVRFININVGELDATKLGSLRVMADARSALEVLGQALVGYRVDDAYASEIASERVAWDAEVDRLCTPTEALPLRQAEVVGLLNDALAVDTVIVNAAGSLPADLHKLWRVRDPKAYHIEYGFSCMGYEIAGGIGAHLADPERDVCVLVGDASYLMMHAELVTAVQEGWKLLVVVFDNHGYGSIGSLSRAVGCAGFGTLFRFRRDGSLGLDTEDGAASDLPIDFVGYARALGIPAARATTLDELRASLADAADQEGPVVIVVETQRRDEVPSQGGWWDVSVAEVASNPSVLEARKEYESRRRSQRAYL